MLFAVSYYAESYTGSYTEPTQNPTQNPTAQNHRQFLVNTYLSDWALVQNVALANRVKVLKLFTGCKEKNGPPYS